MFYYAHPFFPLFFFYFRNQIENIYERSGCNSCERTPECSLSLYVYIYTSLLSIFFFFLIKIFTTSITAPFLLYHDTHIVASWYQSPEPTNEQINQILIKAQEEISK